jgi:hypothetical protein
MPEKKRVKVTKNLEVWLSKMQTSHANWFPYAAGNYASRYTDLADYLNKHVHTEVERGALLADLSKKLKDGSISYENAIYLNNHGPGHVSSVIERASDLLRDLGITLSPYEGYLLLAAIHFHDVGNILGREEHEKKCLVIMNSKDVSGKLGDDTEKRVIARIASAHGGITDVGSKDTISPLLQEEDRYGQEIRPRFLAAILRFADELADDRSRASRFSLQAGTIPAEGEIYHAYSFSLQSVLVKKAEVRLSYEINPTEAVRKYKKPDGKPDVYLLDEIYSRIEKMHQERMYCMRFWPPTVQPIARVRVKIEAFRIPVDISSSPTDTHYTMMEDKTITFSMEEEGYPGNNREGACILCLGMKQESINGEQLKAWVEHADQGGNS